jgi:hypothetical protein
MLVGLSYKFINKECIETKTKWCKSHETYDNCWCFAYPYTPSDISEEQFVKHVTTGKNFTPAIFEKQYRKKANFKSASLVGLDFDNGISTNDLIQHTYSWLFWFVYATASSKPEYPKSRAIIRLDQPITDVKEYESVVKGLIRLFSINDPDDKAKDASRMFYGSVTTDFKLIGNIVTLEQVKKVMPKDVAKDQSTHKPYPTFATGKELLKRNGNGNRYLPEVAKEIEEKLGIARIGVNSEGFVEKQLSCPFLAHEHDSERPASGWCTSSKVLDRKGLGKRETFYQFTWLEQWTANRAAVWRSRFAA